jgi:hypothetical protein
LHQKLDVKNKEMQKLLRNPGIASTAKLIALEDKMAGVDKYWERRVADV